MKTEKKNITSLIIYVAFFSVILIFNYLISKYQFFITEGWFESFAVYMNDGIDIYKEYDYFLPPLTVHVVGRLIDLFGLDFISLRYIFILLHALNFYVIFLILKKYTDFHSAIIGSLLVFFLIISNSTFLAKDYHTIVSLLVALTIYILPSASNEIKNKTFLFTGLLVALLILTKHNVGVLYGFGLLLYLNGILILHGYNLLDILKKNLILLTSIALLLFAYTIYMTPSWVSIFSLDTLKGSIFVILFRFILDSGNRAIIIASALLITFVYAMYFLIQSYKEKFTLFIGNYCQNILTFIGTSSVHAQSRLYLIAICLLIISIFIIFTVKSAILYVLALSWPLLRLIRNNSKREVLLCIPLYALAYCGTTTAGFNSVSLEILLALFFAELIFVIKNYCLIGDDSYILRNTILPVILVTVFFGINKLVNPSYQWWGYKTNSIIDNIKNERSFSSGIFRGMHMDKFTYDIISFAKKNANNNILTTPSIPMFNLLSDKQSKYNLLFWYDTTSSSSLEKTIEQMNYNPPMTIYMLKMPNFVHRGHYGLIKKNNLLPPKEMEDTIIKKYVSGQYNIDFTRANIDIETCDSEFVTDYIDACNLEFDKDLLLYVSEINLDNFENVVARCVNVHQCSVDKEFTYKKESVYVYKIDISNQYWYKEIIEKGKSLHVNNKELYSFYSFVK